jgi:hypothetical protein
MNATNVIAAIRRTLDNMNQTPPVMSPPYRPLSLAHLSRGFRPPKRGNIKLDRPWEQATNTTRSVGYGAQRYATNPISPPC